MTKTPFYQDSTQKAVRRDHGGRTSRGLSVELARFCYENPIFRDDPAEMLADLKQCAADCIGPGCVRTLRTSSAWSKRGGGTKAPAWRLPPRPTRWRAPPSNPFSSFLSSEIKRVRTTLMLLAWTTSIVLPLKTTLERSLPCICCVFAFSAQ